MNDDELLAALGDALNDEIPPVDESRVDALRGSLTSSAGPVAASQTRSLSWLAAVAAAVVVVVGAVAFLSRSSDEIVGETEYAGPVVGVGGEGELTVVKTGIGRVIELDTRALEILPTGEYYEVWFVGPGDSVDSPNRVSAGTFHPDENGRSNVTFAAAVDPAKLPFVEITAEPGDGDPSPSGQVVLSAVID